MQTFYVNVCDFFVKPHLTFTTNSLGLLIKHEVSCHVYEDVYNWTMENTLTDSEPTFGQTIDVSHFHENHLPNLIASVPQNEIIVLRRASALGDRAILCHVCLIVDGLHVFKAFTVRAEIHLPIIHYYESGRTRIT